MVEVVNRQRYRKIDPRSWENFAAKALQAIGATQRDATIAFVSSRQMRQLNKRFRGINRTTDVLSFSGGGGFAQSAEENLGDIAIAVDQAESQARENGLTFEQEVAQLILHGLLHLSGYDHEADNGEMNRVERRLKKKLGI
jgi:probable rRNA maturation factor